MAVKKKNTLIVRGGSKVPPGLPFGVVQTEEETYMTCLGTDEGYKCFSSLDTPVTTPRNKRRLKIGNDLPADSAPEWWDEGSYRIIGLEPDVNPSAYLKDALDTRSSFIIEFGGNMLRGSYRFDWDRQAKSWFLKKEGEEDDADAATPEQEQPADEPAPVQPAYEEGSGDPAATKNGRALKTGNRTGHAEKNADARISTGFTRTFGNTLRLQFRFFKGIDPMDNEVICLVSDGTSNCFLMRCGKHNEWQILTHVPAPIARLEDQLSHSIQTFLSL